MTDPVGTLALAFAAMISVGTLAALIHDLSTGYRGPEISRRPTDRQIPRIRSLPRKD